MSSSLNVIALISGGKDSFFSLQHALANGHNIVALANLHPAPTPNDEDLNSYMYQTVGHSVIPLYAEALDIPLYRQEISGKAVNSNRDYTQQEQDETEDLVPLLRRIKSAHPHANAVSSGAILSTYQRTRVESVALRLGLVPLAFLWQYPLLPPYSQTALLHDMAAAGLEAVIIKTASGGLDERFLGWNVAKASTIARLQTAMARFGETSNGAVVGEGGEFETLALDGPRPLWKKRVRIQPGEAGVLGGGQAVLKIEGSELGEKSDDEVPGPLRIPELFDDEFKRILDAAEKSPEVSSTSDGTLLSTLSMTDSLVEKLPRNMSSATSTVFTFSNLASTNDDPSAPSTPSEQLTTILSDLSAALAQHQLPRTAINHCTLLLRNMSDFTLLNPIYGSFFSAINPPARVTIAAGPTMPTGIDVMLSVILDNPDRPVDRQALHVQGRSYWAPANIGPYSQAVSARLPVAAGLDGSADAGSVVYVAGQIPLVPASMEVFDARGFPGQVTLALQHLWRVGRAMGVRWWTGGVGFIPACEDGEVEERVRVAQRLWGDIHSRDTSGDDDEDEDEDVDPWDRLNTHATSFDDTTHRAPIPCSDSVQAAAAPPCFIAQVEALPRGVDVEWSATGLTCASMTYSSVNTASGSGNESGSPSSGVYTTTPSLSSSRFVALELRTAADVEAARRTVGQWACATLYGGRGFDGTDVEWEGVQWVPCRRVWGAGGKECVAVVVGRCEGKEGE